MLGPGVGLAPQRHYFALGIPTCWYLKMLKFALPPTPNLNFALPPTPTPDASQWNIGRVWSSGVGHVYFMYISCCLCIIFSVGYAKISRCKGRFQWNMGFRVSANSWMECATCVSDKLLLFDHMQLVLCACALLQTNLLVLFALYIVYTFSDS